MRTLVCQGWMGAELPAYAQRSINSAKEYAKQVGAEYKFYEKTYSGIPNCGYYVSLNPFKERGYDRILFLDVDVLVHTHENIFDLEMPDDFVAMVPEKPGPGVPWWTPERQRRMQMIADHFGWDTPEGSFNSGVILTDGKAKFNKAALYYSKCRSMGFTSGVAYDQPCINLHLHNQDKTTVVTLDDKWNSLDIWGQKEWNIKHYAGGDKNALCN